MEEREVVEPGAYVVIWMMGMYFFVRVEPIFNWRFVIHVHVVYFRSSVDGLIDRSGIDAADSNDVEPTSWFGVEVMNVPLIFLCLLIGLLLIMVEPGGTNRW